MTYKPEQIDKLREVRKLVNILENFGPTSIVPGGKIAILKFGDLIEELKTVYGMTEDDIEQGVEDLEQLGYPAK